VSPRRHFFAAAKVALGATLSATWIVVANYWNHEFQLDCLHDIFHRGWESARSSPYPKIWSIAVSRIQRA
jgi:hypothetical protein